MWRYLREFLSDPRVIELHARDLVSDPLRPGADHAAAEVRRQLREDLEPASATNRRCAPITRAQSEKLAEALRGEPEIVVDWGDALRQSVDRQRVDQADAKPGCDRILAFPLYPQYSATTTATANDKLFRALMKMRTQPAVRSVPPYYDEPVYIEALARSIEQHLAGAATSSRRWSSPPITAFRSAYFERATPITATARRRRGCCANGSAGTTRS